MAQAQEIHVTEELATVKSTVEALLSGREAALESGAWRAAVRAVFALCSVPPSRCRLLQQQTSKILRQHLNSVKEDILDPTAAASGNTTAAPDSATPGPDEIAAHLGRVGANLRLNLAPIFNDTKPPANCEAPKALLQRYATAWETFLKAIKKMEPIYVHFNLQLIALRKAQDLSEDSILCACEQPTRIHTECSVTYDSWPNDLREFALHKWLECVLLPAGKVLRRVITTALRGESEGRPFVSRAVLKSVIDSFLHVRQYDTVDRTALHREWVVQPYLLAVRGPHAERAQALLVDGDLSHYMSHMLAVNVQELVTLLPYFGESICKEVQINFQQVAVVPHVRRLWAAAPALISAAAGGSSPTARYDLHHLFLLLRVVNALPPLLDAARAHFIADGRAMLARQEHRTEMHNHFVDSIMTHRQKYCLLFAEVFDGDKLLCLDVLDKALRVLVNDIPVAAADRSGGDGATWRAPELLARYCDALLRRRDDELIRIRLAAASFIFMYLNEKDVFQDTYQKMLAKRLLNHSSSLMLEEKFVSWLRHAGTEFNGKLRAMYQDIAASFALNEKFREWTEEKREPFTWGGDEDCREHSVQVLQGWAWPLVSVPTPWEAPAPLESYTKKFEAFYKERHPRRRLAWLHELCTGELALRYAARPYELAATGAQCGLLLAFQERDRWGAEDLRARLQLSRADWARQLQPLLKLGLLLAAGDVLGGDASGEEMQGGDASGEAVQGGDASSKDVQGEDASGEDVQGGDASAKDVQGGDVSGEDVQGGDASAKDVQGGDVSGDDVQGGDASAKDVQGGDASGVDVQGKEASAKDVQGGDASAKDVQGGDVSGEDLQDGEASGKDVQGGDGGVNETPCAMLTLNLDFSHKQLKIKITCSKASIKQPAPSPAAQAQAPARRDLRCKAYTQALLMRIMKKRKVLHRVELLQELEAQSNGWFSPAPELVRTYIDELVFKEYLEPAPGDSDTYKYLP